MGNMRSLLMDISAERLITFFARGVVFLIFTSSASAKCFFYPSGINDLSLSVSFGNELSFVRDSAIGAEVLKYAQPWSAAGTMYCDNSVYNVKTTATVVGGSLVPGYSDVYKTGVDGIGIKFFVTAYGELHTAVAPFSSSVASPGYGEDRPHFPVNGAAKLIVTGQIRGGKINAALLPSVKVVYQQGSYETQTLTLTVKDSISILSKGCKIENSRINVKMPKVIPQDLALPAGTTNFGINLADCPSGVKVYATLTDASNISNVSDILTLSSDSTAKGIGFQVSYAGKPVRFGPESALPGTTNQFLINESPGSSISIPMSASYIKTGLTTVRAGVARGQVILNMSYQ